MRFFTALRSVQNDMGAREGGRFLTPLGMTIAHRHSRVRVNERETLREGGLVAVVGSGKSGVIEPLLKRLKRYRLKVYANPRTA